MQIESKSPVFGVFFFFFEGDRGSSVKHFKLAKPVYHVIICSY